MITEDYVSFKTAKLLKEKGFDEKCTSVYHDGELQLVSSLGIFCGEGYGEQILTYTNSECEWSPIMISAPTLQMAMKWLREEKRCIIVIIPKWFTSYGCTKYAYSIWADDNLEIDGETNKDTEYNTYEKACEAAIKYCLEKLI